MDVKGTAIFTTWTLASFSVLKVAIYVGKKINVADGRVTCSSINGTSSVCAHGKHELATSNYMKDQR